MRTTLLSILISAAVIAAVACGNKNPKPTTEPAGSGTAAGSDTGAGSDTAAGSDTTPGSGSAVAGSGSDAGSGSAVGAGSDAGSGAGSGSAVAEDEDAFAKLTHEDKLKLMKTKVLPAMTKAFKEFDKKEFGKFGCKTCHGKGVASGKYEMPNPDLPKLDFAAIKAGKQHPKTVEFMEKVVKPQMAEILGMKEMSPDNPKGFGCLHCHQMKQ